MTKGPAWSWRTPMLLQKLSACWLTASCSWDRRSAITSSGSLDKSHHNHSFHSARQYFTLFTPPLWCQEAEIRPYYSNCVNKKVTAENVATDRKSNLQKRQERNVGFGTEVPVSPRWSLSITFLNLNKILTETGEQVGKQHRFGLQTVKNVTIATKGQILFSRWTKVDPYWPKNIAKKGNSVRWWGELRITKPNIRYQNGA